MAKRFWKRLAQLYAAFVINTGGGKRPVGSAAWQMQQIIGEAVRAHRSKTTVGFAPRGGKPSDSRAA